MDFTAIADEIEELTDIGLCAPDSQASGSVEWVLLALGHIAREQDRDGFGDLAEETRDLIAGLGDQLYRVQDTLIAADQAREVER